MRAWFAPKVLYENLPTQLAGERLCVDADADQDGYKKWHLVQASPEPVPMIDVRLDASKEGSALFIRNGTGNLLKYKAALVFPGRPGAFPTSVCPLPSKGAAFENWPQPVAAVVLWNVHVSGPNESMACER
jgi:hypothetical protein